MDCEATWFTSELTEALPSHLYSARFYFQWLDSGRSTHVYVHVKRVGFC